jgi:hypothetical protein
MRKKFSSAPHDSPSLFFASFGKSPFEKRPSMNKKRRILLPNHGRWTPGELALVES